MEDQLDVTYSPVEEDDEPGHAGPATRLFSFDELSDALSFFVERIGEGGLVTLTFRPGS